MPLAEFLKLLEIKLFGHLSQRVLSRLLVTEPAQDVNQPLPGIRHMTPQSPDVDLSMAVYTVILGFVAIRYFRWK